MIETFRVAAEDDLRLYRIDAAASGYPGAPRALARPRIGFDPFGSIFASEPTETTRYILEHFDQRPGPPGEGPPGGGFRVACHVVSLPDLLLVIDSTFSSTGPEVFPGALEAIARREGRTLEDRRLVVLYTHAHWDHAGGHEAVQALGQGVHVVAHRYTAALHASGSPRDSFLAARRDFFADCGITRDLDALRDEMRRTMERVYREQGLDASELTQGAEAPPGLRVDQPLDLETGERFQLHPRVEVLVFEGHVPGHLCVRIDGRHLVSGDMWLPATTSTITPATAAVRAGVPAHTTGIARYIDSSARLLEMDVDDDVSYPSHETIFRNPKRMALRDLELFAERFSDLYLVLAEHADRPLRVLDVAWGGRHHLPLWKIERSKQRLMMAHDEAHAHVQDLAARGDLREVEPGRYLFTGRTALHDHLVETLERARRHHGHLEFRSRGQSDEARVDWR